MPTQVLPCTCNSVFQDKTYGIRIRIFNQRTKGSVKGGTHLGYRCTVCGKDNSSPSPKRIEENKPEVKKTEEKEVKKKGKKIEERKRIR